MFCCEAMVSLLVSLYLLRLDRLLRALSTVSLRYSRKKENSIHNSNSDCRCNSNFIVHYQWANQYHITLVKVYILNQLIGADFMHTLPRLPRYFASIISSRVILNIRQYANVQKTSVETGLTEVGGEMTQPVSALRFASGGQTISAVDTDLRLY